MILRRKTSEPDVALHIAGEMISNNGEDCSVLTVGEVRSLAAVFDGCGGIGARIYNNYSGKTGAFVSSRSICGAVERWFESSEETPLPQIQRALEIVNSYADRSRGLRGSLHKDFPTTAVITTAQRSGNELSVDCFWAGDSRAYLLTTQGLHQITIDDISNSDALDNLSNDGALTNVISASLPFELHHTHITAATPLLVFAATDGCFGYLKTPMEFEALFLRNLMQSDSIAAWKEKLRQSIADHAGDDYSLCLLGYGFSDFMELKRTFARRALELENNYILPMQEDPSVIRALWESYRNSYYAYCDTQR